MKIAILHQDLEWAEEEFQRQFKDRGIKADLYDVRDLIDDSLPLPTVHSDPRRMGLICKDVQALRDYGLVLNRVYASVANRNWQDNMRALMMLGSLEALGMTCLNSLHTTLSDYSKSYASETMHEAGVLNPRSLLVTDLDEYDKAVIPFVAEVGYPLVVKRDMGGRGKDLARVNDEGELEHVLQHMLSPTYKRSYDAGLVVQQFLHSVRDHDCRIAIVDGEFAFSYKRTLISSGSSDDIWLASVARGSEMTEYTPEADDIEVARKATEAIGAMFNEVDITYTSDGPAIIENNPSPSYDETEVDRISMATELIVKRFIH